MYIRILFAVFLISIIAINSGCSGLKDFPTFPIRVISSDNEKDSMTLTGNSDIQRFEIEGFIVIFDKKMMRITIIPTTDKPFEPQSKKNPTSQESK